MFIEVRIYDLPPFSDQNGGREKAACYLYPFAPLFAGRVPSMHRGLSPLACVVLSGEYWCGRTNDS